MEQIWNKFRRSRGGRLLAATIISAGFGAFAAAEVAPTRSTILLSALGSVVIGLVAVSLLERRDQSRSQNRDWQRHVDQTTAQMQKQNPGIPDSAARTAAQEQVEQRFTPLVWCGMALGGFCALCGVAMFILRVLQFFRTP